MLSIYFMLVDMNVFMLEYMNIIFTLNKSYRKHFGGQHYIDFFCYWSEIHQTSLGVFCNGTWKDLYVLVRDF